MKVNEMTNLYIGYNKTEDFRILICAFDAQEAQEIATGYCIDTHLEGNFEITEFEDVETHFDCDYIIH